MNAPAFKAPRWRDGRGAAVVARGNNTDSATLPFKPADRVPGSVSLEELERRQRTYAVEYKPALNGTGLHWTLTITGRGHWCEGSNGTGGPGLGGKFRTEAEAHAAGKRWIETGRTRP